MKFPFRSITKPQIKKIHTMKRNIGLSDDNYEALLHAYGVESSKEFNRKEAADFIDDLVRLQNGETLVGPDKGKKATGALSDGALTVYFNRDGKITDNQIDYMGSLWLQVAEENSYEHLMHFINKIIGTLYIHLESLSVEEASKVIYVLEKWHKQKELS